jgi:hypothetical protein
MSKLEELDPEEYETESEEEEETEQVQPSLLERATEKLSKLNVGPQVSKFVNKSWKVGGKVGWAVVTTAYVVIIPLMVINLLNAQDSDKASQQDAEAY